MTQQFHCWAYTPRKLELKETHVPQCSLQHCLRWHHLRCPLADKWIRKLWYIYKMEYSVQLSSVQSLSHVQLFATPWITARQASLSITNSWSSLKLMSIESVMPSSHLILCRPLFLLLPIPPAPNPSQHQGLFQWVNSSHEVAKVLEFQLQHQSFQWIPRTDLL